MPSLLSLLNLPVISWFQSLTDRLELEKYHMHCCISDLASFTGYVLLQAGIAPEHPR